MIDKGGPAMADWFYQELKWGKIMDPDAVGYVCTDSVVQKLRVKEPAPQRKAQFIHIAK
jgi:hypothetical protein